MDRLNAMFCPQTCGMAVSGPGTCPGPRTPTGDWAAAHSHSSSQLRTAICHSYRLSDCLRASNIFLSLHHQIDIPKDHHPVNYPWHEWSISVHIQVSIMNFSHIHILYETCELCADSLHSNLAHLFPFAGLCDTHLNKITTCVRFWFMLNIICRIRIFVLTQTFIQI